MNLNTIKINASRAYDVIVGAGLLKDAGEKIGKIAGTTAVIVSDDNVFPLYGKDLRASLESAGLRVLEFVFPHGERSKTLDTYGELLEYLCENRVTRTDALVALGGGVAGDLTGFAAATYQRGIGFVQIPTTLLSAVDASVGGKTAVDLKGGKNQAGAFYQPHLVLCDTDTLKTLPVEEYRCGCAEVIKYAMIGSRELFTEISETPVMEAYEKVICRCVEMKRDIVVKDEFDRGERMLLNFGHTFGHCVEALSGFSVLHGQAVAMGMAAVTKSAVKKGVCPKETETALMAILNKYGLPTDIPYKLDDMLSAAGTDKKNAGNTYRLIIPETIGRCRIETLDIEGLRCWMTDGGIE